MTYPLSCPCKMSWSWWTSFKMMRIKSSVLEDNVELSEYRIAWQWCRGIEEGSVFLISLIIEWPAASREIVLLCPLSAPLSSTLATKLSQGPTLHLLLHLHHLNLLLLRQHLTGYSYPLSKNYLQRKVLLIMLLCYSQAGVRESHLSQISIESGVVKEGQDRQFSGPITIRAWGLRSEVCCS